MHHEPYLATVTVVTRSQLLRIPAQEMHAVMENEPKAAGRLSQSIVRRIMERREPAPGKRVVALHSLASRIHEHVLGRRLADALGELTRRTVLRVHFSREPAAVSLANWAAIQPTLNGAFHYSRQLREIHPRCFELDVQVGADPAEAGYVAPLISHLGSHFDYVLIDAGGEVPQPALIECLVQADLTYILMRPETAALYKMKLLMGGLGMRPGGTYKHISPVICADNFEQASRFSRECGQAGCVIHSILHSFPFAGAPPGGSAAFDAQVRRMAREIGRCRVGLALSSGGARGLAHIGVIQVLEEYGIEIDAVAGASMGAYVGAVWTYGHDGAACEKIARDLERRWGLFYLMDPVFPPRQGFFRTRRVGNRLRRAIGRATFLELVRPLRVVATDLDTLGCMVFSDGEVAEAVEASIAIPGVCTPVTRDGHMLIDGGIANPLPVDVLSDMGVERIIAVNTLPTPAHLGMCLDGAFGEPAKPHPGLRAWFNRHLNYFARGNVGDILMRANFGGQMRVAEQAGHAADIVLRPWACDARWHDFTNPGKYIALGRKVAMEQLAAMKALTQPYEKQTAALALAG
jgi:NTE family protein